MRFPALSPLPRPAKVSLEACLLAVLFLLLVLAIAGPFVVQPASYHDFADHRSVWGTPFAMDVLSNLPFAAWGVVGLVLAWPPAAGGRAPQPVSRSQQHMALVFFAGLLLTAACSAWYHLAPSDAGLAVDRCGMVLAFAGLLGLSAGGRVSDRAGTWLAAGVLLLGPVSVAVWSVAGNVMPWLVLQFGGMALIVWFACLKPRSGALPVHWGLVILLYAVAKWLELGDQDIYALTGHVISGHSLKHITASCAAWPVVSALMRQRRQPPAV